MAGSVGDDEFALGRRAVTVGDIDGNALLWLGLDAVRKSPKIDAFAAAALVLSLGAFDLVYESALRFHKQPSDKSGFSVVDVAGSREPKDVGAQKYPSRFLSSMVLAPWSMILVERSLIFAEPVSSAISSNVEAHDATAPVHGAHPSVRKRTDIFTGTSPALRCIASSAGISTPFLSTTNLSFA